MSAHGYLRFTRANARFLGFGFTMAFASSVGQTFFIGVFGPAVRAEFGLSHTSWGAVYMAGTLLSAAVLTWTGPWIDRLPLKRYTTLVCVALVIAAAFMAQVPSAAWLVLAIFLLRQSGQGLASHVGNRDPAFRTRTGALLSKDRSESYCQELVTRVSARKCARLHGAMLPPVQAHAAARTMLCSHCVLTANEVTAPSETSD